MFFLTPVFVVAGLVAAAGPLLIHLLNRRRFKVVDWAAMDFLREAIVRSRRIMQLRDLLLMALRTLCILAFGAALARPFLASSGGMVDPSSPVHAVLLIDNSLSMGYQELDKTVLDRAKVQAKDLIDGLARGSRISVVPTCSPESQFSYSAYYNKDDAKDALDTIRPVDRSTGADSAVNRAMKALGRVDNLRAKRVVLFTDRQAADWPVESLDADLKKLPCPMQLIEVEPAEVENAWIADFRLRDGVADLQTPAVFLATIAYEGATVRQQVPVTLTVEGAKIAVEMVDLQPGQRREIQFPPYQFNVPTEQGKTSFATAEVSIPQDRLPADDQRFVVAPVVARLPVVFVDQFGQDEDRRRNRYGETFPLRRLLAPMIGGSRDLQPVEIRHVTIDQLQRDLLQDARLVVVAGVMSPEASAPLLAEYVEQGGNLVIAAGGFFDPALWTQQAWLDGLGILPAPLAPVAVGQLPEQSPGKAEWFQLDFDSLVHDYFLVEGTSQEELQDLFRLPYFFKAVDAKVSDDVQASIVAAAGKELDERRRSLAEIDQQLASLDKSGANERLGAAGRAQWDDLQRQRARLDPDWLLWSNGERREDVRDAAETPERLKAKVLARYTNGLPFMIERRMGRGQVVLITTGLSRSWNTLAITDAVLIYDRLLRAMLQETVPSRNVGSEGQLVLPVPAAERTARFVISGPDGQQRILSVDAQEGSDRFGVTVGDWTDRGLYRVTADRTQDSARGTPQNGLETKLWEVPLAVNGLAEESQLLSNEELALRQDRGQAKPIETTQATAIGLQRTSLSGEDLWKWVMLAVLACLLLELIILAWPTLRGEQTA